MTKKDQRKSLGSQGEQLAAALLQEQGLNLLFANWKCRSGEIDLIAEDPDGVLVFVEVRSRTDTGTFGTAAESVDYRKRKRVRETAQVFLHQQRQYDRKLRFDVVAVLFDRNGELKQIEHIPEAF